jgi:Fic family protein
LKGAGNLIPNPSILINSIPLQEARSSSEIENIVTTQDALFRAVVEDPKKIDPQTKEVLRYRTALKQGYDAIKNRSISIDVMIELCATLQAKPVSIRDLEPIIVEDKGSNTIIYTPPRGRGLLLSLLHNLEHFLSESGYDPLIRLAVAHYQFEAIHPFVDGNGRTGRILNLLIMLQSGLLDMPVLYLSRYLIQNKQEYYRLIRRVTEEQAWEDWLVFMLTAIEQTASWTTGRIQAIHELLDQTAQRCRLEILKIYSKELVEVIFTQPYCKIAFLVQAGIAERKAASRYLQQLERMGILAGEIHGKEIIYKNLLLLEILSV